MSKTATTATMTQSCTSSNAEDVAASAGEVTVQLHQVAHARAGDKGNRLNVSVMPYDAATYACLAAQLTEARVLALYAHRGASTVKRYDLPLLPAFNFVIDNVLEGGVNGSLNLDGHGKSNSFILLAMPVRVPARFVRKAAPVR